MQIAEQLTPLRLHHVRRPHFKALTKLENIYLFDNTTDSHLMERCHVAESLPNTHFVFINSTQLCWVGTAGRPLEDDENKKHDSFK